MLSEWFHYGIDKFSLGYIWLKRKFNPLTLDQQPPQLVIHVNSNNGNQDFKDVPTVSLAPASLERISLISFDDIRTAIESAPPLQRDRIAENYVGLKIEWDTYLKGGSVKKEGTISLRLTTNIEHSFNTIWCDVPLDEYRELGVLPEGAKVRVSGEIVKASTCDIELKDVRLHFYGK
jgi:hypothetical protein